ncbi:MAG: DUF2752 domain-containing protein, partial [Acidimicrobiia bacterium]
DIQAPVQILGLGGLLAAGGLLAYTSVRLPLICPLRLITGVPCPFCGMTTGTVALMRGDLGAAVAANPFSPAVVLGALGGFVDGFRRLVRRGSIATWLFRTRASKRVGVALLLVCASASWVFQLFRFDVL